MPKWTDIATVVIAFVALAISIVSYLAANKSNEIASSALKETQKFNKLSLKPKLEVSNESTAIIIRNEGKGSAIIRKLAFSIDNKISCHNQNNLSHAIGSTGFNYRIKVLDKNQMIRGEGGEKKIVYCDECIFEGNIPHSSLKYHIEYSDTYSNDTKIYNPTDAFKELECQ